jgi:hypothetical protein
MLALLARASGSRPPPPAFHPLCRWPDLCPLHTPTLGKEATVLWTIFLILLVLWLLGLVSGYTLGGFIHILLVVAIVVVLVRVIQGRRPV